MEANNIPIGPAPAVNKFTENDIPRCPKCNLISSLNLIYKKGDLFLIIHVKICLKEIYY